MHLRGHYIPLLHPNNCTIKYLEHAPLPVFRELQGSGIEFHEEIDLQSHDSLIDHIFANYISVV